MDGISQTRPGIHKLVNLASFPEEEQRIIKRIGNEWYVTNGGTELRVGSSTYRFMLIKPTPVYQEMFNLDREIIVIFSNYANFEPRTLDTIDTVQKIYQSSRLEKICSIIISKDPRIGGAVRRILNSEQESQIIVPFTYQELISNSDGFFMRNRFKEYFYKRDLFDFQSPLRKELYFFGRSDLIHSIVNRHRSHENAGLFGLRKTGKTSVIFGIERALTRVDSKSVFIDCQITAFHRRRWNTALQYIIHMLIDENNLDIRIKPMEDYQEENAAIIFEKELHKVYEALGQKSILIIFDEIENITFDISPSEHWAKGLDFVYFWQTLRSLFQRKDFFSYLIVGTNAMCVEAATIHGKDNPIFNQVPFEYIPSFDMEQTKEMVKKLGRLMGLKFDDLVYAKLTEDFGGHPFLIRHVCSVINTLCPPERPFTIDKSLYERGKLLFSQKHNNYVEMILGVLNDYYNDEYAMLEYLALEDIETFNDLANLSPYYTNHLLGYGIIDKPNDTFYFKIETVKDYLVQKNKYKKIGLTPEAMIAEISERRNNIEPKLRLIVRNQLKASLGKSAAKEAVLDILGERRKNDLSKFSFEDLFDPNKSEIYWEDLRKIINKYWDVFKNIFARNQQDFDIKMQFINKMRADAHAKVVSKDDMQYFRICMSGIENLVGDYF